MAMVDVDGGWQFSADSQPKSIGLVWGLAATRRSVYIHQMNRVNSRNEWSSGMRNHSNFTVVPVPVPVPGPTQRSKRKQIQLAYDCQLDVSQGDVHSVQTGCTRVQI